MDDLVNYRLITILGIFSKILEKLGIFSKILEMTYYLGH